MEGLMGYRHSNTRQKSMKINLLPNYLKMKKILFILGLALCYFTCFSQLQGTIKDSRDGKIYKTVKMGTETWLAENLAYIPNEKDGYDQNGLYSSRPIKGNYWVYDNQKENEQYGFLYDWGYAINVCPTGWHLPTDADWTSLTDSFGGAKVAGEKLKSKLGWKKLNGVEPITKRSSFNALPGGCRMCKGSFCGLSEFAYFWSSTPNSEESRCFVMRWAYRCVLNENKGNKKFGYSVRCVMD